MTFSRPLITAWLPDEKKHRVMLTFSYTHDEHGKISVPRGFLTDCDSVPRLPLAYWLLKDRTRMSAIVHDWLYFWGKLKGKPIRRKTADRIFLDAMEEEGVGWWRRRAIWLGVRAGGWRPWNKYRKAVTS